MTEQLKNGQQVGQATDKPTETTTTTPENITGETDKKADKDPEIQIKQVPMDGVCGGY